MITLLWTAALGMNIAAFALMGVDKRRARRGAWRIPERTLFLCAALMGALGGTAGMFLFRHKTRHRLFRAGFPLLAAVQAVMVWRLAGVMR